MQAILANYSARTAFRQTAFLSGIQPAFHRQFSAKSVPTPPPFHLIPEPGTPDASRILQWAQTFKELPIENLKDARGVSLAFSRSSGPGGQNVNKVSTKVTLRCPVTSPWIPTWAKEELVKDPHYVASTQTLMVTSTLTRSQAQNIDDCLRKLKDIVLSNAMARVENATPQETKERVQGHIKADKERRKADKQHRASVKRGRKDMRGFE